MDLNFSADIVLENERVILSPLSNEHFKALLPISIANPNLLQYSPSPFGIENSLKENFTIALESRKNHKRYPFVIYDKLKAEFAGSTSFLNISNHDKRLEIGATWLGPDFQRTGLNRNCKFLLLQYIFEVLKFERAELKTDSRNIQSQTAIKAIGAKLEGALRSHTLMLDGYRRDTVYFSILKNEWNSIKETIFLNY